MDRKMIRRKERDDAALKCTEKTKIRFLSKIKISPSGCWLFKPIGKNGYCLFLAEGEQLPAHRFSKIIHHGIHDHNLHACHLCLQKNCVNPQHIVWQTASANMKDKVRDGTADASQNFRKLRKLSRDEAREVFRRYHSDNTSSARLSKMYGLTKSAIWSLVNKKTYANELSDLIPKFKKINSSYLRRGSLCGQTKLKETDVLQIRVKMAQGETHKNLSKEFDISYGVLRDIRACTTWKHILPSIEKERIDYIRKLTRKLPGQAKKLTAQQVTRIKKDLKKGVTMTSIAKTYKISLCSVSDIKHGRTWKTAEDT